MEVAHTEMIEKELDAFIERRSRQSTEQRPEEVMYAESVRRYNAARSKERRAEWYAYHADQAERLRRSMTVLVAFYEDKARQLLEEGSA